MTLIGYDPARVRVLHRLAARTIDALDAIRTGDPAAVGAMATARIVRRDLDERCLALAQRVLVSDAMLTFGTVGLPAGVVQSVLGLARGSGGDLSTTDRALISLLHHFATLDVDDDGELTGEELALGRAHPDAEVRAACDHLLDRPLILVNVALAGERMSVHSDVDVGDVRKVAIDATAISHALAQNQVLRLLADPATFAALDRQLTNEIDGLVSADDLRGRLVHEADPAVRGALEVMLATDLLGRIDRQGVFETSNGTIAYDQVYALGVHQGAFEGLADPAVPAALRDEFGPPEPTGDRTPQFLHHPIEPQPGMGHVMIALFIESEIAGAPGLGHWAKSRGNDRGADPHAHPSDSKGWAVVDYETGLVTVRVNPSCSASGTDVCHDPLAISMDRDDADLRGRNHVGVSVRPDDTEVAFGIINSDKRWVAPRLDANFQVRTHVDGTASVEWERDDFPDLEIYHVYPDGRIVQLVHGHSGPVPGLLGFDNAFGSARG